MARARCASSRSGLLERNLELTLTSPVHLFAEPRALIHSLLNLDPFKRPSVREILNHPWFTKSIYPSPPPSLPASRAPSPASYPSQLPTSPTIEEEHITFTSTRSLPTPVAEEPVEVERETPAAPGSEAETTASFDWKDGESDQVRSGRTSPTTVGSEHAAEEDDALDLKDKVREGSPDASLHPFSTLKRAGSESTIRKSSSDSGKASLTRAADQPVDPIEQIREEEEDPTTEQGHPVDHAHAERDRLLKHLLPFAQHSKTPSRTKRRSVSSSFSERLTPSASTQQLSALPHRGAVPYVNVDYLALLSDIQRPEFTTAEEDEMLRALKLIGVDTGQLVHSVKTNACDTSGAFWWILWGKGANQRRESLARRPSTTARAGGGPGAGEAAKESESEGERQGRERERTARPRPSQGLSSTLSVPVSPMTVPPPLKQEVDVRPAPRVERLNSDVSSLDSVAVSLHESLQPPPPPKGAPTAELATVVDDSFGRPSIHAGPINVEPPTPELPSSQSMQALQAESLFPPVGMSSSRSFPNLSDGGSSHPTTPAEESCPSPMSSPGRSRRAEFGKTRSSSVSMLQSLAAGLTRKKSDDKGFKDEVERRNSASPAPPLPNTPLKSPKTPRAELLNFGRQKPPHVEDLSLSASEADRDLTPSGRRPSVPTSIDSSSGYSDVTKSASSPKASQIKGAGLFSTFRMWFKDDPNKRRKRPPMPTVSPRSTSGSGPSASNRSTSRQSIERRPKPAASYYQPERRRKSLNTSRPSMQHRSSSQASSHHSRRSSLNSSFAATGTDVLSPTRPALDGPYMSALHRRPSDPTRPADKLAGGSSGEFRPRSRPSSIHSFSLHAHTMERNISRSPTASSAGSVRGSRIQASPLQNYHRRVGSGSSTKVVRQLKIVNPPSHAASHMRSPSMASIRSMNSVSSSPSSTVDLPSLNRSNSGSAAGDLSYLTRSPDPNFDNHSSDEAGRSSSSLGSYGHTVLVAHRPKSALSGGISHSPYHSRAQHRSSWDRSDLTPRAKPVLRDVFASKAGDEDGEWVDEDEGHYEGGLGQSSTRGSRGGNASHSSLVTLPPSSAAAMSSAFRGRGVMAPPSSYHGRPSTYSSAARPSSSPRLKSNVPLDNSSSASTPGFPSSSSAAAVSKDTSSSAANRRQLPTTGIRSSGIMEEEEPEDE